MKKPESSINFNNSLFFDFAVEIIILIVIFIMPTIFDRRLGIVFSGTKTAWMRTFGSIFLGIWAIKLIVTRKHPFIRTPMDWPVLSFLLCTTIAALTSVHVYTSMAGFYGRYEGLSSWFIFGIFFFVITNYIKSFAQLKRIIVTVLSAGTIMAVYSIIQRHAWDPYMWGGVITWQRVIGTIGQPNFLAAYMLMAFFLVLSLFLMKKEQASPEIEWSSQLIPIGYFLFCQVAFLVMIYGLEAHNVLFWYFAFSIVTASALLFSFTYERLHPLVFNVLLGMCLLLNYTSILYTQSRGGYMGLFTGMVVFALFAGRHWLFSNWKKISVLGFAIILVSGITMLNPEFSPLKRFTAEITTETHEESEKQDSKLALKGAAGSRGETWKSAFNIISDNPLFGVGPEVLKMVFPRYETEQFRFLEAFHVKQDRCHNETLDVGVTKGLIAFSAFVWLLFVFFRIGVTKGRRLKGGEHLLVAGLLAAAVSFLVQNQFSFGVVAITSLFWIIWGMLMVIGEKGAGRDEGRVTGDGTRFSWVEVPWLPVAAIVVVVSILIYVSFFSFRADVWFKSGKTKMGFRQIPQAIGDFEKSLAVYPIEGGTISHLGIANLNLSYMSSEKKRYLDKAISVLEYGTQVDPFNADNFFMLSKVYLMLADQGKEGALKQAESYADIALKIDPYYAEVYNARGMIYERQGKFKQAAQQYKKAFFVNPNLTEPMQRLENVYKILGTPAEALKIFDEALDRYGDNLTVLETAARLYLAGGKLDGVITLSGKMARINPKFSPAYVLRAEAFMQKGMLDRAFSDFQQVILNEPKNIDAHNGMGKIYLASGSVKRAKEEFEQVLMLDANNAVAKKMLETIN